VSLVKAQNQTDAAAAHTGHLPCCSICVTHDAQKRCVRKKILCPVGYFFRTVYNYA